MWPDFQRIGGTFFIRIFINVCNSLFKLKWKSYMWYRWFLLYLLLCNESSLGNRSRIIKKTKEQLKTRLSQGLLKKEHALCCNEWDTAKLVSKSSGVAHYLLETDIWQFETVLDARLRGSIMLLFCYLYSCAGKKVQEFSIIPKVAFIWTYLKMLAQILTQTDI